MLHCCRITHCRTVGFAVGILSSTPTSGFRGETETTEMVTQYKYLGIELMKDLTIADDVRRVNSAFNRSAGMLM